MLQESESYSSSNISSLSSVVMITDPDGCLVYVSRNVKEVLGVHSEDTFFLNKVLEKVKSNGHKKPAGRELFLTKDQRIILEGRDGNTLTLIADVYEIALPGCHRQITIRKIDEITSKEIQEGKTESIAESEQYYYTVADHAPISVCVITGDRFTYVNEAWEKFTGYTRAESRDLNPFSVVHPSMRDTMLQRKEDDLAGKTVPDRYDLVIIDKQNKERWTDVSVFRLTKNGQRIVFLYAMDITDRKMAEFALKQSEARLLHLMDSTVEAIVGVDLDGVFTFINRSGIELLGYDTVDEFFGKKMHELIHHSNPDGSFLPESECTQLNALKAGRSSHSSDVVYWRKDGSSFPASCRLQLIDIDGHLAGAVVTFLDISEQIKASQERKRLEDQLRHAQKMEAIGTLAGGIAHDFNNILGGIIGYGELIEIFDIKNQAEINDKVGRILKAAYRAKDLVNQVLAFSRKMAVEFDTVNLIPLLHETVNLLRASLPSTIRIETSFSTAKDIIFADPTQIHQVLLNLCTNAADSMEKGGGSLTITLGETTGAGFSDIPGGEQLKNLWLMIEVKDTGHGFSSEIAERIFEPFFTTKKVGEGTGMGLALVYGIVTAHKGFIVAESQPGIGSVFRLILPQYIPEKEALEFQPSVAAMVGNGRILFVDDEEDLVMLHKEFFQRLGYEITALTSSEDALECFARAPQSFDLVITDETMPGLTGTSLALKIHEIRTNIPILLCTGKIAVVSQDKVDKARIIEVLKKPVSFDVLGRIVSRILEERT
ncbi:MAG: PAS domain S-box-containing protein [Desulforhopalus sp.]|jgi:PAS domain S-box-containing protein